MSNYRTIFDSLDEKQKSDFLLKVLVNSESLQNQLMLYFGESTSTKPASAKSFAALVNQASGNVSKILQAIDLEDLDYDDYDDHRSSRRYYDRWEVENELAETKVQEVMSDLSANLIKLITKGELDTFMVEYTGCLDAIMRTEIYDPNDTLGDPEDTILEEFHQLTNECEAEIKTVILNPALASRATLMAIQWFQTKNSENAPTQYHDQICSSLLKLQEGNLTGIKYPFNENPDIQTLFPKTYLTILQYSDPSAWVAESERLAASSPEIAKNLLDYLYEHDQSSFYKKAGSIFDLHPQSLVDLLAARIDPTRDHNIALRVWEYKVDHQKKLDDYLVLSGLFNDRSQKETFLKELAKSGYYEFYLMVLTHEKMYDKILALAKAENRFFQNYERVLAPIVNVYPQECFELAVRKVAYEMNSDKLSRHNYERIASLLKVINSNPDMKPEIRVFVKKLMETNSRRIALREELVKAGLLG